MTDSAETKKLRKQAKKGQGRKLTAAVEAHGHYRAELALAAPTR